VTGERLTYDKAAKKGKPLHKNDVNKLRNTQIVCVEYDDITYARRPPSSRTPADQCPKATTKNARSSPVFRTASL
jgi:hypothetical protein